MNLPSRGSRAALRRSWLRPLWLLLAALPGCVPGHYRRQADRDAYELVGEHVSEPQAALEHFSVYPDPRSRMFDPFDPDHEPLPPDDPQSHRLMHCVDGKEGYRHWHRNGDTSATENPDWRSCLPLDEQGVLVLDERRTMELALLHSRDYQLQWEELYLSALDVSFERFRFDTLFFGGYQLDYLADGRLRNGGGNSQSLLTASTFPDFRLEKLGASGTDLLVSFANSLVWQFSGPDDYSTSTLLDLTLIQPLLRRGGRDRVLEQLTQTERTLLANVRQMERYRRGFYVEIMTGVSAGPGPSRGGFSLAGSGGGGSVAVGGFLRLLQTEQEIRNQEDNVNALRSNYFRLLVTLHELMRKLQLAADSGSPSADEENIARQRLQVAQARQAALNAESRLLTAQAAFQTALDRFKLDLGLPPTICVKISDPLLDRVNVIDPAIRPIQAQVSDLQQRVGDVILELLPEAGGELIWSEQVAQNLRTLRDHLDAVEPIRQALMDGDQAQIQRVREDGLELGRKLQAAFERALAGHADDDPQLAELRRDADLLQRVLARFDEPRADWIERVTEFARLRDALADLDRMQQQLVQGGAIELGWMGTDPNRRTRRLYQRLRDRVQRLSSVPADERVTIINELVAEAEQEKQLQEGQVQQIVAGSPWLAELDRWRIPADEVEKALQAASANELRRLPRLFAQFVDTLIETPGQFNTLPERIGNYQADIDRLIAEGPQLSSAELMRRFRLEISPTIPQELVELAENVLLLSLVQARNRAETVALVDVDLHPEAALEIARAHRGDWMNARAALVDAWRQIRFNQDNLQSTLDVVFRGDLANRDDNPFSFDSAAGRLRVGLQFDAPITRLAERNTYREALIEYQQRRREYYAFEDDVARRLRDILRTLQLNQRNFEIRREAVRVADLQIQLNEDIRKIREADRQPSGATAARDTVSALSDLLTAQNDFLSVWVTYEVLRRALDFDLGTMQLDGEGLWIDPGPIGPDHGLPGVGAAIGEDCWPGPLRMPDGSLVPADRHLGEGCLETTLEPTLEPVPQAELPGSPTAPQGDLPPPPPVPVEG